MPPKNTDDFTCNCNTLRGWIDGKEQVNSGADWEVGDRFLIHRGPTFSYQPSRSLKTVLSEYVGVGDITTYQKLVHRGADNVGIYETWAVKLGS